ncbi:MAG: malectin domain-containing carbohydrate-binding protein [Candidatus Geothermincolia bacterium]
MHFNSKKIALLAGLVVLAGAAMVLVFAGGALAAGPGQPVVELQQNASSDVTYPNIFTSTHIAGTDSYTKQEYKFQRQREGKNFSYAIGKLLPSTSYSVELSFVEHDYSSAGKRIFNVYLQGATVLYHVDVFSSAGGKNRALQRTYQATTNSAGVLVVALRSDQSGCKDYATISTIRLYRGGTSAVEASAWTSRLNMTTPTRFAGTTSQDGFEAILGRLGARSSIDLLSQKLAARFAPLGDGTGDVHDLVLALTDGATTRSLPLTDRYPVWENMTQSQSMTSQTFQCSSTQLPFAVNVKFRAPFYPGQEKLSSAPFFYIDVTVTNQGAAAASPSFVLARSHKLDFAGSAISEYSTPTEAGLTSSSTYNYYDETQNPFKARSATESIAVPAGESGDVDFRGSAAGEFADFAGDSLWSYVSPPGYPSTYSDYKQPIFSFYPRGYTGAVWSIADLAPGASVTKHFVLASYVPDRVLTVANTAYSDTTFRFRYTTLFANVGDVVNYAVNSRSAGDAIESKSDFFDSTVSSDSYLTLPSAYRDSVRNTIMYGFQSYLANTWWMRSDGGRDWFSVWEGSSCRYHGTVDVEYNHAWFYFYYWPDLLKQVMSEWVLYLNTCQLGTYISHDMGVGDVATGQAYPLNMAVEENTNFILLLYKYWKTTGDLAFVEQQFGLVRQLVDFIANCDENNNGLPDLYTQNTVDQGSYGIQKAKDQVYLGNKCLGAYQAAREMAMSLSTPDAAYASKCRGQVELINQTLEYDMWLSDHFAVCSDQDASRDDAEAYSIYTGNGLLYLMSGTRSAGVTSGNVSRLRTDLATATEHTLKTYGCSHSSYDQYNQWVSQNLWRDQLACQMGVGLHNDNPLALTTRYWNLEKYFAKNMNGTFWDVVVYPGGSGPTGASATELPYEVTTGAGKGKPRSSAGAGEQAGAAATTYQQSLGYYPRGAASLGLLEAVAGLTLDRPGDALYYQQTTYPIRVPVFERADWANADPAARVPTLYFTSMGAAPQMTNRTLLPGKVATRAMKDISGLGAGSHAISPNSDGVNDTATITYSLPAAAKVTTSIWSGSVLVKAYPEASFPSGARSFTWDGKNSSGTPVPDGTYTAKVDARATNTAYEIRPASVPVYVNGSIPDLSRTWYLAEGFTGRNATGGEFEEYILIQNPNPQPANTSVRFMMPGGATAERSYTIAPSSRFTITVDDILPNAEVSTFVSADVPIAVERSMYFSGRKAGHDSIGVSQPSKTWYLAEGYTADTFDEYVLIQNPGDAEAAVTATFMTPGAGNEVRDYTVGAHSRFTIHVDEIIPAQSVSTQIDSSVPVVVERAQYLNNMTAGTCSIGASSPSSTWYLAEGYTDQGFEEWVLIQNPQSTYNNVTVTFMESSGNNTVKQFQLPPKCRFTIEVDGYLPASEVSVKVRSESPVLVERAMYWNNRSDGHDCIGTPTPDSTWYLPEGYTDQGFETWVLIQNPGDQVRNVTVTFMQSNGTNTSKTYQVAPRSRFTVSMDEALPAAEASVKVTADGPVIVERAVYFNNRSGGTDSIGVRGY